MSITGQSIIISDFRETAYNYGFDLNLIKSLYTSEIKTPPELKSFIYQMFYKYNLSIPNNYFLEEIFSYLLEYIDFYNPYILFEKTNIRETENKYYYQYRANTDIINYFDPNEFNTFEKDDYNYEALYHAYLNPWFNVKSIINEPDSLYNDPKEYIMIQKFEEIKLLIEKHNVNIKDVELAFNTMLIWIISPEPEALKFRRHLIPIIDCCLNFGEGIIFCDSGVLNPNEYIKMNIPTHVCVVCNQRLPCSKFVEDSSGNVFYFCRHHININSCDIKVIKNDINFNYEGECTYNCDSCLISECMFSRNKLSVQNRTQIDLRFMIAKQIIKKKTDLKLSLALKNISRPKFLK